MKIRTRKPAASTDIGSAMRRETARKKYIAAQVAKNPPNEVASCPRLDADSAFEKPWSQKASGLVAALSHPPPAEMHSPADQFADHHRPALASTDNAGAAALRKRKMASIKIAINDDGHRPHPLSARSTDSAFGTDDLFTFACDQHAGFLAARIQRAPSTPSGSRAALLAVSSSSEDGRA